MACIIDMSILETFPETKQPTLDDFKAFNKGGPDIENQLDGVEEYHKAVPQPRSPLNLLSCINVFSFLPIFGVM
jgi:hypothetical protein